MRSLIAASLAAAAMASSDHWAVIIAGSNTYGNYRHQSDAHHAYKIMVENDISPDQIILMVYDDIANNFRNPYKGQLFNSPTGPNVYDQTTISYSGAEVNKDTFLAVLTGDSAATGGKPVLQSNANSKVFIYYSDHGATGLVAMPTGDYLYADELQAAIDTMEANQMYDEVVFYLEACESGSMFPDLQASQKVYAMTASNAYLSSYAAYCGTDAYVDGVNIGSCLGDEFSVSWMEDTESHNINTETLQVQHDTVKTLTTGSPVQIFGDFDIMSEPVANFEGNVAHTITEDDKPMKGHRAKKWGQKLMQKFEKAQSKIQEFIDDIKPVKKIDSRDVALVQAFDAYVESGAAADWEILNTWLTHRGRVDKFFATVSPGFKMDQAYEVADWDCYRFLINSYEETCEPFSDYSLKYAKVFADVCSQHESKIASVVGLMNSIC